MLARFLDWMGAGLMMASPFIIDTTAGKSLAIGGLALLCLQAWRCRAINLLALNIVGIMGYCYAIYF